MDVGREWSELPTEQLEEKTCALAAQVAAATCRLLLLIGELERCEGGAAGAATGDAITTAHGEPQDLDWTIAALCCLIPPDRN